MILKVHHVKFPMREIQLSSVSFENAIAVCFSDGELSSTYSEFRAEIA
jgi:hypothetical protein